MLSSILSIRSTLSSGNQSPLESGKKNEKRLGKNSIHTKFPHCSPHTQIFRRQSTTQRLLLLLRTTSSTPPPLSLFVSLSPSSFRTRLRTRVCRSIGSRSPDIPGLVKLSRRFVRSSSTRARERVDSKERQRERERERAEGERVEARRTKSGRVSEREEEA